MNIKLEEIYHRISEIAVEYVSYLNSSGAKLTYQGFKEFLEKDSRLSQLLYEFSKDNINNATKSIFKQLDVLEIYLGKDKIEDYKLKVKKTKEIADLTDTISMIFYDLYVNFDSVNHSFLKLIKFLNTLNTKIVKSHDNMISTVDDSIKNLKEEHFTETKIISDIQDINKLMSSGSDFDIIGKSVMEKVDNIIQLVEKNIENKIHQIDRYEKILQSLKTDIAIYERQTKILEAEIKKVKKETITDEITGLYSFRMIPFRLSEEDEKFLRRNTPYSVMILRVQKIDLIDDRYIDYVKEFIMIHLADLVRKCIRKVDIPFVYKNDGILIIMPETDMKPCKTVAKRIVKTVEKTVFKYQGEKVSASIGLSCIIKSENLNSDEILNIIEEKYEQILKEPYFKIID